MTFFGEFETHITLALGRQEEFQVLLQWSQQRNIKCTYIVLERGLTVLQPMLTVESQGTLQQTFGKAKLLQLECEKYGFSVSRVKLEVAPWNADVPLIHADNPHQERYFEHHIKLLLPSNFDLLSLQGVAERHGAHLSRNARRVREDGQQERFVTQRCYNVGHLKAKQAFNALIHDVGTLSVCTLEIEEEYVVYDSNIALDAGWLD